MKTTTEQETAEQRSERLKQEAEKAIESHLKGAKFGKLGVEYTVVAGHVQHVRVVPEYTLK